MSSPSDRWTTKEKRQYEHIKSSSRSRGEPLPRAKEIAARTVNKQRREKGETKNKRTQGTGNPRHPLADRTKEELYNKAGELGISGRSKMNKQELIRSIKSAS